MAQQLRGATQSWIVVGCATLACALSACGRSGNDASVVPDPSGDERGVVAVGRCLNERGWDVHVNDVEDSISFQGRAEQASAYDADYRECDASFGSTAIAFGEFTDEMWQDLYDQESATADCLRGQGVDVPAIPSYETFVERYQGDDLWTSYSFLPTMSADREQELNTVCPQPEL